MSPCEQYQELISRLADGDLSPREEKELRAHIETCPDCAMLFRAFSAISRAVEEDMEKVPFDLRENVMAEIRREEIRKRNRLPRVLRVVMSAAACVAVIVGVYLGVSLSRGGNLSTAAYQSAETKQESAAVMTERSAPAAAPAEEPAAPQLTRNAPAPTPAPELPASEDRLFADSAAAPAAPQEADEAAGKATPALGNAAAAEAAAEEPAPEAEEDAAPEAETETEAEAPAPEPEPEEIQLRGWDLSLLRSLLGGRPAELEEEDLAGCLRYRIRLITEKEDLEVLVYERDGVLYYRDPAEGSLYQAELAPAGLDAFLH